MPDEEGRVDAEGLRLDRVEVLRERRPACHHAVRPQRELHELPTGGRDRCDRVATVARQLGRVALPKVAHEGTVDEERGVGVSVRVDEAWRDDMPGGIDHVPGTVGRDRARVVDGGDPVAPQGDVGEPSGGAGPIDDGPAAEQQVEGGHDVMMPSRTGH
jgi:hypothetical protein